MEKENISEKEILIEKFKDCISTLSDDDVENVKSYALKLKTRKHDPAAIYR